MPGPVALEEGGERTRPAPSAASQWGHAGRLSRSRVSSGVLVHSRRALRAPLPSGDYSSEPSRASISRTSVASPRSSATSSSSSSLPRAVTSWLW